MPEKIKVFSFWDIGGKSEKIRGFEIMCTKPLITYFVFNFSGRIKKRVNEILLILQILTSNKLENY